LEQILFDWGGITCAIENKQINEDWLLDDAKWNLKIKQLECFEGFDGKHFFTWNKSFLTGVA
jgi:hypothetical protein